MKYGMTGAFNSYRLAQFFKGCERARADIAVYDQYLIDKENTNG